MGWLKKKHARSLLTFSLQSKHLSRYNGCIEQHHFDDEPMELA
jgi:hypothetical protein